MFDVMGPKYHSFMDFDEETLGGVVVPQAVVVSEIPPTTTVPIRFVTQGSTQGVSLPAALQGRVGTHVYGAPQNVVDPINRMFKLVIHWPGYDRWAMQLQFPEVVTINMVAQAAAGLTKKFYDQMRRAQSTEKSRDWWVSEVDFNSLMMVELRNVAPGTWQPFLIRVV